MKDENETYDPIKRREIIKTVLIIFLTVLLILTFCSNTIMNKSLPEISTERTASGKLTERIRGSGMAESNQSYEVKIDGNKVIDTIMIKSGQKVEKGDVLFTVGTEESESLSEAEETLAALELEYQKALLTPPADYSEENQAIKNARADLNNAIARRNNAIANQGNEQAARDDYNYNKNQLSFQTRLQEKIQSTIAAIDMDDYSAAAAEYTGDLIYFQNEYKKAESEYNAAYAVYAQLTAPAVDNDGEPSEPVPETDINSAKADADRKAQIRDNAKSEYENLKYNIRNDLVSQLESAESEIDWLNTLISDYESSGGSGLSVSIDELDQIVQEKQRTLDDLTVALNKAKTENENQSKITDLDTEAKKQEIERQKAKIEKLKKENAITEITSKYSGVVSSVNVKPGEETVPDMPAAVIDITDEGYTLKITVDAEKSKKIKKGTAAEVVNNWNGDIEAVLTDIKNDTAANSKNRILVFSVTGDIDSGTYIDLSIPCGSGSYDTIVPKSSVYQDKDGYFVLTVTSKSSPLGNRYYAEKVPVEVIASDEVSSAVQGNISTGDYVITTASKPVNPKDQVRIQDK